MDNEVNGWDPAPVLELDQLPPDPLPAEDFEASFQALIRECEQPESIPEEIQHVARLQQQRAALDAEESRALANLTRLSLAEAGPRADRGLVYRSLSAELALACHLSDRTFQARIGNAETLVHDFPRTLAALETGTIGVGHARVIVDAGSPIGDPEQRARYEAAVLDRAADVTPGRLRKLAQVAAARLGEVTFEQRHRIAVEDRAVRTQELGDGMSEVIHTVSTVYAVAMLDRLTAQAKAVQAANPDDPRTLDQIRADLATELVLTGQPTGHPDAPHAAGIGIRAEVSIVIPALTLLGRSDEPATIAGAGPIGLAEAARLAGDAPVFLRILTHPVNDQVLAVDSYRPSRKLRRYIHARDGRCRCPSCTRAANSSDLDHTLAWQHGGKTTADNLAALCPKHHTIKHLPGWSVRQISPGVLEWTTPHGIVATDYPDTPIKFQ
ncbi:HNH endonuclease signature motif containing protein [Diaminobutyricimonas sp. TR449]|uniref:HNH endonuclease signature motif containing protein n=1 Tax=Diaminobutyricimonas sp. TR449 TaxID=2708076 RepID=UPI0014231EF3|nr:HNH endonuclease signature motif containing protein [Diaminobutyricimonas sp. TR449]